MQLQDGLSSGPATEHSALKSDLLIREDIGYYQGAAYIYEKRLNAWQPPVGGVAKAKPTGPGSDPTL
jgi:hypothetical protein